MRKCFGIFHTNIDDIHKFVNVPVITETNEIKSNSMLMFTHKEVGTEQKVIKLKLKIGTRSIIGVRS